MVSSLNNPVVLIESSSRYHIPLSSFLVSHNIPVYIANPKTVFNFIKFKSPNNPSKSDTKDAFLIALFAKYESKNIKPYSISDYLKLIARKIESISQEIAKTKTQIIHALDVLFPELDNHVNVFSKAVLNLLFSFPSAYVIAKADVMDVEKFFYSSIGRKVSISAEDVINLAKNSVGVNIVALKVSLKVDIERLLFLEKQVKELEDVFVDLMKDFFCEDVEIVSSIAGVSEKLACSFISEIESISRFENAKKLISYAGTDPVVKQSGRWKVRMSISKQGNPHLRNILYQMATGVVMWNDVFKEYYRRKYEQFKSRKKAMIAVVNKLVRVVFAMLSKRVFSDIQALVL
ncbi:IS110 family transposase [Sulfurihydrogenibium subterraneum]|uniref:IS110 family transposase n=1 Tax=Sulfurihydrogenibium subterraneum TaxID=171121 RepID=UPI001FDF9DF8|nr:IS110 family transposase [Sulfurihydrogenibium subterraneum]